jgi:hypothetical protein
MSARRRTYSTAHHAIYAARGPAYAHPCVGCGISGYSEWSYNHNDPNETWLWHSSKKTWCPCGAPEFYSARCPECHRLWDKER